MTLGTKVRELQPNPFGKCEFKLMPQVRKTNHARLSKGMEGPRVTKLGTHSHPHTLMNWPKFGDCRRKGLGVTDKSME